MQSLLVEFLRFKNLQIGMFRADDDYLVSAGDEDPVREWAAGLDQDAFLDLVAALRYRAGAEARSDALETVGAIAASALGERSLRKLESATAPVQVDLVVNPMELGAIPFEAATDSRGRPLFVRADPALLVTRRLRFEFADQSTRWPSTPRVLYAWASPGGVGTVPAQEHADVLRAALEPWDPADDEDAQQDGVLAVLPEMTLKTLGDACARAAASDEPFTHVHLLAHGYPIEIDHRQRFGMALHSEEGDLEAVAPEAIVQALEPLRRHTVMITVATCDSANVSNTTTARKSIAHLLHQAGFPVVVASQLPLTVPGSTLMVEKLYTGQLRGDDVRVALHAARVALYDGRETMGHDWASLTGYVRLPEGYDEHLKDVRLEAVLASLKTTQRHADRLVTEGCVERARFDRLSRRLRDQIGDLERFLTQATAATGERTLQENLGLLGSANKRLAEVLWVRRRCSDHQTAGFEEMFAALRTAWDHYRGGSESNLSHHWTAVQCLSLEVVLEGKSSRRSLWHAAVLAAELDSTPWGLGSLGELHLLARHVGLDPRLDEASRVFQSLRSCAKTTPFVLESTRRQLRRYVEWWTTPNGFFAGGPDLAAEASALLAVLEA